MRSFVRQTPTFRVQRPTHRMSAAARDVPSPVRRPLPTVVPRPSAFELPPLPSVDGDGPHVDYARSLTEGGGVRITYKDIDARLRHTLWRILAWSIATFGEGWYVRHASPVHTQWVNFLCFLLVAAVNAFIVWKTVHIYRTLEIRPDALILEGRDVFWRRLMENGFPAFKPDKEGNQILCGIYGTRFVEYLTIRRFDECDRTPEVFAAHLQDAMRQLWELPQDPRQRPRR